MSRVGRLVLGSRPHGRSGTSTRSAAPRSEPRTACRQILETNADTEFGRYHFIAALAELVDATNPRLSS
jgi:hypothetical protein